MALTVLGGVALSTILLSLWRAIATDGYGVQPPPRSHHDVNEVDSWGMPTEHVGPR